MSSLGALITYFNKVSVAELDRPTCEEINNHLNNVAENIRNSNSKLTVRLNKHKTKRALITSSLNSKHLNWAMKDEFNLSTQTEWVSYWIAKLRLCQNTIEILSDYIRKYCNDTSAYQHRSDTITQSSLIYESCQSLGIAIFDYIDFFDKIEKNLEIKECQFIQPAIEDPESKVSETITTISNEIERFLLSNPNNSVLGFSALRIFFESYVIIMARDKIRAHIRIEEKNNNIDARFSEDLLREDVFCIITILFPELRNSMPLSVLNRIYDRSSRSIHRGVKTPSYLIWTCWDFIANVLKSKFDKVIPGSSERLKELKSQLEEDNKLIVWNSRT